MTQLLRDEPKMSQTLRLGFGVFCLFPNIIVPTFLQMAENINCIMNGVDGEWIEMSGVAGTRD